jgi:hypothetical protein
MQCALVFKAINKMMKVYLRWFDERVELVNEYLRCLDEEGEMKRKKE